MYMCMYIVHCTCMCMCMCMCVWMRICVYCLYFVHAYVATGPNNVLVGSPFLVTGWGGVGWGALLTFLFSNCQLRSWCYATNSLLKQLSSTLARFLCNNPLLRPCCYATTCSKDVQLHPWSYATNFLKQLPLHSWCYAATLLTCSNDSQVHSWWSYATTSYYLPGAALLTCSINFQCCS